MWITFFFTALSRAEYAFLIESGVEDVRAFLTTRLNCRRTRSLTSFFLNDCLSAFFADFIIGMTVRD